MKKEIIFLEAKTEKKNNFIKVGMEVICNAPLHFNQQKMSHTILRKEKKYFQGGLQKIDYACNCDTTQNK
jgi:hypothetical protein